MIGSKVILPRTTMAQILSRAVNCLDNQDGNPCNRCQVCKGILEATLFDVIEIDAASNNSVENVRNIRDEVVYTPSVAKYKVYIIDEVHMLSPGAFNALLKTLEEPPAHVIFILATTEPNKLPATILSRCQRYDFHRISINGICEMLFRISGEARVELGQEAANMIARIADGALRDAISLFDQCISMTDQAITPDHVLACAGILNDDSLVALADCIHGKDASGVLTLADRILSQGKSPSQLLSSLIHHYRNILVYSHTENPREYIQCSEAILAKIGEQSKKNDLSLILYIIKELSAAESVIKRISQPKAYLEIVLINLCSLSFSFPEQASIIERISLLEKKISGLRNMKAPEQSPPPQEKKILKPAAGDFDWDKVLRHFDSRQDMDVCPYLVDTTAVLHEDTVCVSFRNQLFRDMIFNERKSIKAIKDAMQELFHRDYELKAECSGNGMDGHDDFESSISKAARDFGLKIEFE
ncbi:MAG: DNA polymerase III subunit gamma/tau [Clostridia bacterium]